MRFKLWTRHAFEDTPRKRAALRRKQQKERDALPLFVDQIAAGQPSEDEVMRDRADKWAAHEVRDRIARARQWRRARRELDAMPEDQRNVLRLAWNCAPYPASPVNLLGFLHSFRIGRIDIEALPFPLFRTDAAGTRIASIFDAQHPELLVNILKARDIAETPGDYSLPERKAAYHHLQAAAKCNKDKEEAKQDRLRALRIWDSFGMPILMQSQTDHIPAGDNWLKANAENCR